MKKLSIILLILLSSCKPRPKQMCLYDLGQTVKFVHKSDTVKAVIKSQYSDCKCLILYENKYGAGFVHLASEEEIKRFNQ